VKPKSLQEDGTTQGNEQHPKAEYPYLFGHCLPNLEDEIHFKGGRFVTP